MKLTQTWVQVSSTGAVLQKLSSGSHVLIGYSDVSGPQAGDDVYRLEHNNPAIMPTITGSLLWAKAETGTARVTITELV
jgi:hypothetical protein